MFCKNCKYWDKKNKGICVMEGFADISLDSSAFEVVFQAGDDQGLEMALRTGPDFGCIHFKR
jgi:hypothetical protein